MKHIKKDAEKDIVKESEEFRLMPGQVVLTESGEFETTEGDYLEEAFTGKTEEEKKAEVDEAMETIVNSKWGNLADRKIAIKMLNRILSSDEASARKLIRAIDKATTEMDVSAFTEAEKKEAEKKDVEKKEAGDAKKEKDEGKKKEVKEEIKEETIKAIKEIKADLVGVKPGEAKEILAESVIAYKCKYMRDGWA